MEFHITPIGVNVEKEEIKNEETGEITTIRLLKMVEESGQMVSVGPFPDDETWERFVAFLKSPEEESARQQARAQILHGVQQLPRMDVPKEKARLS